MKTALYDAHRNLGAKIISFAGWQMPLSYAGIVAEHRAVRKTVGLFDVSHMGCVEIKGADAEPFLDYLSTNAIKGRADFSATYTVWANEEGGSVDDTIVFRKNPTHFFAVANASNRQKDLDHLLRHVHSYRVSISPSYESEGILALQGPLSSAVLQKAQLGLAQKLKPMRFAVGRFNNQPITISRTGYTGEMGFELFAPQSVLVALWKHLLSCGKEFGLQPCGLGARDTLRLESGYALYGHELTESIAPTESISSWTVKWEKGPFLGKEALLRLQQSPEKRTQYGLRLTASGVPREGCEVFKEGKRVGVVTSGTFSPCLKRGIAIAMTRSALSEADAVEVQVRTMRLGAEVVKLPFLSQ